MDTELGRMEQTNVVDDGFGFMKSIDPYGNEFIHPNFTLLPPIFEALSRGEIPVLDWKPPAKQHVHSSVLQHGHQSPSKFPSDQTAQVSISKSQPLVNLSPFDFDEAEFPEPSFESNSAASSPSKAEPRKKIVGTLDHALRMAQQALEKPLGNPRNTPPSGSSGEISVKTHQPDSASHSQLAELSADQLDLSAVCEIAASLADVHGLNVDDLEKGMLGNST